MLSASTCASHRRRRGSRQPPPSAGAIRGACYRHLPFDQFTEVLQVSFDDGGASGFIAGRSVWHESLGLTGAARQEFLETAAPRLDTLRAVATGRARPWTAVTAAR